MFLYFSSMYPPEGRKGRVWGAENTVSVKRLPLLLGTLSRWWQRQGRMLQERDATVLSVSVPTNLSPWGCRLCF